MTDQFKDETAQLDVADEAAVARWLRDWVQSHGGTDLRDTGSRLVLECYCGKALGPSYGPTDGGSREAEVLAYFQHQAADLLAALSTPPASERGEDRG